MDMVRPLSVSLRVNLSFDFAEDFIVKISSQVKSFSLQKNFSLDLYLFTGYLHVMSVFVETLRINGVWQRFFSAIQRRNTNMYNITSVCHDLTLCLHGK